MGFYGPALTGSRIWVKCRALRGGDLQLHSGFDVGGDAVDPHDVVGGDAGVSLGDLVQGVA